MDPARERNNAASSLQSAATRLGESLNVRLIPQEGVLFGFALRGARDSSGVVAIQGGITEERKQALSLNAFVFGMDDAAVRAILTAQRFDPSMRSAAVLRFSERALLVLEKDLFLECASFAAVPQEKGTSTMDWGIAFCCKDGVPDVIFEKNPDPARSRLVIFGENPDDVANNIIICSNRI
jgi:predicted fused transcriptional regulator/phosphomethylpyrimidine kinase